MLLTLDLMSLESSTCCYANADNYESPQAVQDCCDEGSGTLYSSLHGYARESGAAYIKSLCIHEEKDD